MIKLLTFMINNFVEKHLKFVICSFDLLYPLLAAGVPLLIRVPKTKVQKTKAVEKTFHVL